MPSLAAEPLIAAACAQTGLCDFAGDGFREGLEALTGALEREAQLSPAGRSGVLRRLQHLLATRLEIVDWRRRFPEIGAQPVRAPIFVIGLPRTGTTALAALLSQDPDTRALRTWESQRPIPPPEAASQHSDPRIAQAQAGLDAMAAAYPEWPRMYDGSATHSTECQDLLGMEFRTWHFCGEFWIPSYDAWLRDSDATASYRFHAQVLELLHWRCPPRRWMLHAPIHTLSLDAIDRVYPDARFLMTHRDPVPVLGSTCSLIGFMRSLSSERRDPLGLGREQLALWLDAMRAAIRFRQRLGEERFADLHFRELEADPVGAVERSYARLGLPLTPQARLAMQRWTQGHRRGRHGAHQYRLEDYGLSAGAVREAFGFYLERFGVENPGDGP